MKFIVECDEYSGYNHLLDRFNEKGINEVIDIKRDNIFLYQMNKATA